MSRIDPTVPIFGTPTTGSVRNNFVIAKQEIEKLEATKATREEMRTYLPLVGGQLSGALTLAADPTEPTQATTRNYVDTTILAVIDAALLHFLPLSGGELTGALTLAANPTQAMQAATREYVDNAPFQPLTGGELIGPLMLPAGDPPVERAAATKLYVDTTVSGAVGLTEAPVDGRTYVRGDRTWHRFGAVPVGGMIDWPSRRIPQFWLLCDGSPVSRITYSQLFAEIGTDWGAGDGETTFNLPDFRGRAAIGLDVDNGLGYSQRVTVIDATQIAAAGGNQWLQAHNHHVNDPAHDHYVHDPSHGHNIGDPGHAHVAPNHQHGIWDPGHSHQVVDHGHSHHIPVNSREENFGGAFRVHTAFVEWAGNRDAAEGSGVSGTTHNSLNGPIADWGGEVWGHAGGINISGTHGGHTGIWLGGNGTGIWLNDTGSGGSQNVQPSIVCPKIIYAGV